MTIIKVLRVLCIDIYTVKSFQVEQLIQVTAEDYCIKEFQITLLNPTDYKLDSSAQRHCCTLNNITAQ